MHREVTYCDHCGEAVYDSHPRGGFTDLRPFAVFASLPFDIASANAGESGVVCAYCVATLTRQATEDDPEPEDAAR